MSVGGYLEFFTTLYGWMFYGVLWDMAAKTGLVYIPIIAAIYTHWRSPYESQDDKPAVTISTRRMAIGMFIIMMVFIFAAVPMINLNVNMLTFKSECGGGVVTGDDTGTTYDDMELRLGGVSGVKVPLWWYFIMSVTSGISYGINERVPCFESIRGVERMVAQASITDPVLRYEYSRFYSECFIPSRAKYFDSRWKRYFNTTVDQTGVDPDYLGSSIYLDTPGLYAVCREPRACGVGARAKSEVSGWPFELPRDGDYSESERAMGEAGNKYGRPYCDEWWVGPDGDTDAQSPHTGKRLSLRGKLVEHAKTTDGQKISSHLNDIQGVLGLSSEQEAQDKIIKSLLRNGPPQWTGGEHGGNTIGKQAAATGGTTTIAGAIGGAISGAGIMSGGGLALLGGTAVVATAVGAKLAEFYGMMYVLREMAPMIYAVLLMAIYMFLPIYVILSGFEVKPLVYGAFIILALKLWPPIWTVARYLDQQLFLAMYPDPSVIGGPSGFGMKRLFLDMLLTALFVVLPMLLLWIMNNAGARVGGGVEGMTNSMSQGAAGAVGSGAGSAARSTSGAVSKAAKS